MHSDESGAQAQEHIHQTVHIDGDGDIEKLAVIGHADIVNITPPSPPPPTSTLHTIPPPPADFTGRQADLDRITAPGAGALITGMYGMGGVGKTALAYAAAARLAEHYPDAQLRVELRGTSSQPLTALEAMAQVIRMLIPTAPIPEDLEQVQALYLSALHGRRGLLLLDNAHDREQVQDLLPPAGWRVLVTSRTHFHLPGLQALDLAVLPEDEARQLVGAIAERLTQPQVQRLAALCGGLPLALKVTASAITESMSLPVDSYLDDLADLSKRLKLTAVDAALQASYTLLKGDLPRLWRLLAVFPGSFERQAAAAVWELEQDQADQALDELCRRSLLDFDPQRQRFSLHDLARLFAAGQQWAGEAGEAAGRYAGYYLEVLRAAHKIFLSGEADGQLRGVQAFDLERHNIEAGQKWAAAHQEEGEVIARLCCDYPDAGAYVLSLRLHPRQHIAWLESAVQASRVLSDRAAEGNHLGNLGNAYDALGEPRRAIEYYEQALVIQREIGDRGAEGADLGNLGIAYKNLGEVRRAIEYYEQALVIQRAIGDRRGEGNQQGNLGLAYADLGEPRRAIEYYEQALVIAREISDRRGEGNQLGNLGNAYFSLGEPRRAIEYYEQALVIAREISDRRGEGNQLGNLGSAYLILGETRRAIEYYEQALVIQREVGDRRGEGNHEFNSALAYEKLGDKAAALPHARRALELYIAIESPVVEKARGLVDRLESETKKTNWWRGWKKKH